MRGEMSVGRKRRDEREGEGEGLCPYRELLIRTFHALILNELKKNSETGKLDLSIPT